MSAFGVRVACWETGVTFVTLNFNAKRSGSSDDACNLRIVRRRAGYADKILPGVPYCTLPQFPTAISWTFVDDSVPVSGYWDYILQIYRIEGGGTFYEMNMSAIHSKR